MCVCVCVCVCEINCSIKKVFINQKHKYRQDKT